MPFVNINYAAVPICEQGADVPCPTALKSECMATCTALYPIKTKKRDLVHQIPYR